MEKSGVIWDFRELSLKLEIRDYSGKMLKKLSFSIFPCVDSRKRVHFGISVTIA